MSQVNHPSHYNEGPVECIDGIHAALGTEGGIAFCVGNAIKYLWRHKSKGGRQDLEKARWYMDWAISHYPDAKDAEPANNIPDDLFHRGWLPDELEVVQWTAPYNIHPCPEADGPRKESQELCGAGLDPARGAAEIVSRAAQTFKELRTSSSVTDQIDPDETKTLTTVAPASVVRIELSEACPNTPGSTVGKIIGLANGATERLQGLRTVTVRPYTPPAFVPTCAPFKSAPVEEPSGVIHVEPAGSTVIEDVLTVPTQPETTKEGFESALQKASSPVVGKTQSEAMERAKAIKAGQAAWPRDTTIDLYRKVKAKMASGHSLGVAVSMVGFGWSSYYLLAEMDRLGMLEPGYRYTKAIKPEQPAEPQPESESQAKEPEKPAPKVAERPLLSVGVPDEDEGYGRSVQVDDEARAAIQEIVVAFVENFTAKSEPTHNYLARIGKSVLGNKYGLVAIEYVFSENWDLIDQGRHTPHHRRAEWRQTLHEAALQIKFVPEPVLKGLKRG